MHPVARPRTAVLVLNWNGRRHLDNCLGSLAALEVFAPGRPGTPLEPAWRDEVWLVDNGSTDDSLEFVCDRFPWVRILGLGRNLGFPAAYNEAVERCPADWIVLLNNDTRVPPSWLSDLHAAAARHPAAWAIASRIVSWDGMRIDFAGADTFFTGHAWQRGLGEPVAGRGFTDGPLLFGCAGALMVRRSTFLEVGGFDADYFSFFEDVDLGWRAALLGHDTWLAADAVVRHQQHATWDTRPMAHTRFLCERNALLNLLKNLGDERMGVAVLAAAGLAVLRAWASAGALRLTGRASLSTDAIAHLLALADLPGRVDGLLARRGALQAGRRRTDGELAPRFGDLARPPTVLGAEYRRSLAQLAERLGLGRGDWGRTWPAELNASALAGARTLFEACAALTADRFPVERLLAPDYEHDWEHPIDDRAARGVRTLAEAASILAADGPSPESIETLRAAAARVAAECSPRAALPLPSRVVLGPPRTAPPTVSVVVRTKDRPELLRRALASLASQKRLPDEVVVVNDGGADVGDELSRVADRLATVCLTFPTCLGRTRAAQAGLEAASGRFVGFLDDDDELLPDHLDVLLATADRTGARVVCSDVECLEQSGDGTLRRTVFEGPPDPIRLRFENTVPLIALLVERDAALAAGGFAPDMPYFEDWDLLLRLAARETIAHCPQVTARYHVAPARGSGGGLTGADRWPALAAVFERHRDAIRGTDWARFYRHYLEPLRVHLRGTEERLADLERQIASFRGSRLHRAAGWIRRWLGR
jgi:GT2 family glycosyltransferase